MSLVLVLFLPRHDVGAAVRLAQRSPLLAVVSKFLCTFSDSCGTSLVVSSRVTDLFIVALVGWCRFVHHNIQSDMLVIECLFCASSALRCTFMAILSLYNHSSQH